MPPTKKKARTSGTRAKASTTKTKKQKSAVTSAQKRTLKSLPSSTKKSRGLGQTRADIAAGVRTRRKASGRNVNTGVANKAPAAPRPSAATKGTSSKRKVANTRTKVAARQKGKMSAAGITAQARRMVRNRKASR